VVSFTTRPLYPQEKNPWYPLDRRLVGLKAGPDAVAKSERKCNRLIFFLKFPKRNMQYAFFLNTFSDNLYKMKWAGHLARKRKSKNYILQLYYKGVFIFLKYNINNVKVLGLEVFEVGKQLYQFCGHLQITLTA
jgi:hypothetical protein